MKTFRVIASIIFLFFVVFSIISCKKNKEEFAGLQQSATSSDASPKDVASSTDAIGSKEVDLKDVIQKDASLFSTRGGASDVAWDQLPAELKNAPVMSAEATAAAGCPESGNIGYWGGTGGSWFARKPSTCSYRLYAVSVTATIYVTSITLWYRRGNERPVSWTTGKPAGKRQTLNFGTGEYLKTVGGAYGQFLDRLSLTTNTGKSINIGGGGGSSFGPITAPSGYDFRGFFGYSGNWIDGIGFYVYRR
jgi:hypothetical protein